MVVEWWCGVLGWSDNALCEFCRIGASWSDADLALFTVSSSCRVAVRIHVRILGICFVIGGAIIVMRLYLGLRVCEV